jgi:hypothetical protein
MDGVSDERIAKPVNSPDLEAMGRYLARVRALVNEVRARAPGGDFSRIDSLANHDEPVEAVVHLAWLIVGERIAVPKSVVHELRLLVDDTEESHFLPQELDQFALPGNRLGD